MFTIEQKQDIQAAAAAHAVEAAALLAVIEVESGGVAFARIGNRQAPLIRWEGHYFDRLCDPSVRERARTQGLASPQAGAVRNPPAQAERWALLERAAGLDRAAAYAAVSWGIGQVMGAHWQWLGYDSVETLAAEAQCGFDGQLALMMRYIDKAGLLPALRVRDWTAFARGYNGPGFARNAYDAKLAAAYVRHNDTQEPAESLSPDALLRRGDRGNRVSKLQSMLRDAGYSLVVDGRFGAETEGALRRFQATWKLAVDGIAGPQTLEALHKALDARKPPGLRSLLGALRMLLAAWIQRTNRL